MKARMHRETCIDWHKGIARKLSKGYKGLEEE